MILINSIHPSSWLSVGLTHRLWQIIKWVNDHNCLGDLMSNSNASLTSSIIARHMVHSIEDDPGYKVKNIVSHVKEVLKMDVSYKKVWYGRRKAIELVFGSWNANFTELPKYVDALMQSNQGTVIRWLHHSDSTDRVKTFKYVGHLLSDKSGNNVPLLYMPLLRDLETVGQYSWGSATLATLYHSLFPSNSNITFFHLWAWERIPTMRPDRVQPLEHYLGPYGARWNVQFDLHRVARHVVSIFRDQLTGLRDLQPYSEDVLASLPAYCIAGRNIWRSITYLICWEVVEPHLPYRIMRRFGYISPCLI
ncbi:unnamed protein product [Coffea canephora]|uniref:DH200=94 genomic scaffold, scaffold_161 n=1 Tax=Coffea canephora TaxID=49390 RepID=A0A068V9K7_COFCA|nr:unnamed protein product [Coffea canephora]